MVAKHELENEDEDKEETWSILGDRGFYGLQHEVRCTLPHKKPANGQLRLAQILRNENIATHRVLVENFYGRLKGLFAIASEKFMYDKENYHLLFDCCIALTNFHVTINPLRSNGERELEFANVAADRDDVEDG